jgi:ABC-type ATPase involved in cell division
MPTAHIVVETAIKKTPRVRQLGAIFDCPVEDKIRLEWDATLPDLDDKWNLGLIVGPSGSGKSTIAREIYGTAYEPPLDWHAGSVIDDFAKNLSIDEISKACQSVGFNTIPAWMRPYRVLSNGEKFRADLARRVLELPDPIVVDEFTSVVDRQVAQIGSHAVQKFIRKNNRKFVAVSCHYDIIDWLQPDWIYDVPSGTLERRLLRRRPPIDCTIKRVHHSAWKLFAPYHYMTGDLNKSAQCFVLSVNDVPAAFAGVIHFPHPRNKKIKSLSRIVTLPDWQGCGLAFVLCDFVASCYKAIGFDYMTHPAHPALIRSYDKSALYELTRRPAKMCATGATGATTGNVNHMRACASFRYAGPSVELETARKLLID